MQASKVSMKVGDAALNPLRQSINRARTRSAKRPGKMNQQQLQLMMDSNISQSLKTLIKNVSELQGTRKFEYLIPKQTVPKPANVTTLRTMTAGRESNTGISSKKSEEMTAHTVQHADQEKTASLQSTVDFANKSPIQRLVEAVRALASSFPEIAPIMNLHEKLVGGSKTYCLGNLMVKNVPTNEQKSFLFAFRDGFGKMSNMGKMRPVRNMVVYDPHRFLHGNVSGIPRMLDSQSRKFSTSAMQLQKKDGKECKKKGGALPCLKASGLIKQDKGKDSSKICEKFCMPCCPPARDPPECVVAQKKRECKKFRAPRPAYSECKKDAMKPIKPCECLIQRLPPCGLGESKSSKAC